ncbi:Zinc finger protein [Halotydeus destructor]|nr:Zinc finger protein [Halotydeus destructor]
MAANRPQNFSTNGPFKNTYNLPKDLTSELKKTLSNSTNDSNLLNATKLLNEDICTLRTYPNNRKDACTTMGCRMVSGSDVHSNPCEPGANVTLEGIVWQETEGGVLVVNVTWREKSYVGTLLDCTKHDWAPPLPGEDEDTNGSLRIRRNRSSLTEQEAQIKLRSGKGRKTPQTPFVVPSSPGRSEKRRAKEAPMTETNSTKRSSSSSPIQIVCPEPNCGKKYKHINGLKYHQTHAHAELRVKKDLDKIDKESLSNQLCPPNNEDSDLRRLDMNFKQSDTKDGTPSGSGYSDISDDNGDSSEQELGNSTDPFDDYPPRSSTSSYMSAKATKFTSNGDHQHDRSDSPTLSSGTFDKIIIKSPYREKSVSVFKPVSPFNNDKSRSERKLALTSNKYSAKNRSYGESD